ncbi:MAG: DNA repair protein RecO [Gammaproteobacteria bacterium]
MRVEPHAVYLLHRRKFRETSAILELLSAQFGRVSCVMKGVLTVGKRRRSSPPELFQLLQLGWTGKGELPTAVHYEPIGSRLDLKGKALFCAMYVNELIVRLVGRGEANEQLFSLYESVLADLANNEVALEQTLRRFEKYLLEICGYGLLLDGEGESGESLQPERQYFYRIEHGPERERSDDGDVEVSGRTLQKLARDETLGDDELPQAKRLMRYVLNYYLGDKPLASRSLFD